MRKWQNPLYKIHYDFNTNKDFCLKFWYDSYKTDKQIVIKFQIWIFWIDWEITRQTALWPGPAGPDRFIMDFDHMFKKKHFLFDNKPNKSIVSEKSRCLKCRMTARGKKPSTESALCVARNSHLTTFSVPLMNTYMCIILQYAGARTEQLEYDSNN